MVKLLLIPGPVEVPFSVSNAGSFVSNHRSSEFKNIVKENEALLNKFSGAYKTVMVTGSGTLAVETMVFSLINDNDRVLSISYGNFYVFFLRIIRIYIIHTNSGPCNKW